MPELDTLDFRGFLAGLPAIELLARTIREEAGNQSLRGKVAVAHVILNRVARPSWWGRDLHSVIMMNYQFSCYNHGTKSLERAACTPADRTHKLIADMALQGLTSDPTGGADHYCRHDVDPMWRHAYRETVAIGDHVFFDSRQRVGVAA